VNGGNDHYDKDQFAESEVNYRKALEKEQGLVEGHFNLGDALYKQGKFADAAQAYQEAIQRTTDKERKALAYYNIGNALVKGQDLQNAVKAYIESLKLNPEDPATKHNLSYVLRQMQQQQHQQQRQNQQQNQQQQQQQTPQREKKISREDAERILAVLKNNEKEVQKKLRARQAVRPKTDKDW
jgi:tetratricopeptide (TPR) repeat protein